MDIEDSQHSARLTEKEILFINSFRNLADNEKTALINLINNTAVFNEYDEKSL